MKKYDINRDIICDKFYRLNYTVPRKHEIHKFIALHLQPYNHSAFYKNDVQLRKFRVLVILIDSDYFQLMPRVCEKFAFSQPDRAASSFRLTGSHMQLNQSVCDAHLISFCLLIQMYRNRTHCAVSCSRICM